MHSRDFDTDQALIIIGLKLTQYHAYRCLKGHYICGSVPSVTNLFSDDEFNLFFGDELFEMCKELSKHHD